MTRQKVIQDAVNKSRREWFKFTIVQEKKLYQILNNGAARIEAQLNAYAKGGVIPPSRLLALLGKQVKPHPDSIRGIMRRLRPELTNHIKAEIRQSINFGMKSQIDSFKDIKAEKSLMIGSSFIGKDGKLRMYDVRKVTWAKSKWGKINGQAMEFLTRTQYGGDTISNRVWDITHQAERAIRNRINTGVLLGESASEIARDVKGYLREPQKRFRRIAKDGRMVLSAPAKRFKPGPGLYRSSHANAMRLVRTETVRAYHEGVVRYGLTKRWIKGWISRVGSDNPAEYDAFVNGMFFPKESPPNIPYHPQCMCHAEIVLDETPDNELTPAPGQGEFKKGKESGRMEKTGGVKPPKTISG